MSSKDKKLFTVLGEVQLVEGRRKFVPKSSDYLRDIVARLPLGKIVSCTFSERVPTRSEAQLDYHWVLIGLMAEHTGDTKDELHDAVMRIKFGTKLVRIGGHTVQVRKSISNIGKMTVSEVAELINYDLELCGMMDIHVPTSEELGYISNYSPIRREKVEH